jgi:hypothetical protein
MTLADAFICDAVRTPFGRYAGALSSVRASDWIPAELLMRLSSRGQRFADYGNATITGLTRETATT